MSVTFRGVQGTEAHRARRAHAGYDGGVIRQPAGKPSDGFVVERNDGSSDDREVKPGECLIASADVPVIQEAAGLADAPMILYRPGLPCTVAINTALRQIVIGNPVRRWFSPVRARETNSPIRFRMAGALTPSLVRMLANRFPGRSSCLSRKPLWSRVQRAPLPRVKAGPCRCTVSAALTVSNAAVANGIDLTGVAFVGAGEPPSGEGAWNRGERRAVRDILRDGRGGTDWICMRERGRSHGLHFLRDKTAVVQRAQVVPVLEKEVGVFHFTSLLPTAPKIMINVASDDFGVLEERQCGCALGELGFHQHLRQIRSRQQDDGPGDHARFVRRRAHCRRLASVAVRRDIAGLSVGGRKEHGTGETELHLLVSPSVQLDDEAEPARVFVEALSRGTPGAALQGAIIKSANAVRVRRLKPQLTANGKLPVFRTTVAR